MLPRKHLPERANVKRRNHENQEVRNFTASNGWLGKWKLSDGVQERKVNYEAGEVPEYTVRTCIKRLWELTMGYEPANI